MATRKNTTAAAAAAYQPPAWLAYFAEPGTAQDAKALLAAAEAYTASMDASLDVLSDEDAPDAGQQLALDAYHKTQDMLSFLGHWRGAQPVAKAGDKAAAVRHLAEALDAGIAAGLEVTAESRAAFGEVVGRLVSGLHEIDRVATLVDDDCQKRMDLIALLAKGMQGAPQELLGLSGYAAADAAGDVEGIDLATSTDSDAEGTTAETQDYDGDAQEACIDLIEGLRRVLRTVAAVMEEAEYGHGPNAKGLALDATRELAPRGLQLLADMEARLTEIPVEDVRALRGGAVA